MLSNDHKRTRLDIVRDLLSPYEDDPGDFIERYVTHGLTTLTESQNCRANNGSPPKKFKRVHSAGKVRASIF